MRIAIPWRRLARTTIEMLPLIGACSVALITLGQTGWVVSESDCATVIALGLVFGVALARTRFPGWAVAPYCGLLSLFTALEVASGLLPLVGARSQLDHLGTIGYMHEQLTFYFDQVLSWWSAYALGDPIRERAVLVFVVGFLLWNLAAWLAWWTIRRRLALIGAIPLGLYLALVVDRSDLSLGYLQIFFFFVFVMHVSIKITARYRDWFARNIDHPGELEIEWGVSAVAILGFVLLSARALPILATPEGWENIREWFQREEGTAAIRRDVIGERGQTAKNIDVSSPELEIIGNPPASGEGVVMWVQISDPPPLPEEVPGYPDLPRHYWRSRIYTTYTGRGWEPLDVVTYNVESDIDSKSAGRYFLEQTYTLDTTNVDVLYAVNQPYAITDSSGKRSLGGDGIIPPTEKGPYTYKIESWAASPALSELQEPITSYPENILEPYLQLPDDLPSRVGDLSARLTQGLSNSYEKAKRIEAYLRANYPYDLEVPKAPAHRDVVDYFLFEAEGGYCSYYASSMVVMLRSIGIPARVVSGYAMGTYDPEMAAYKVVEGDSHAWVEVYFPALGWVEFEPTANRPVFTHSDQVPAARVSDDQSGDTKPLSRRAWFLVLGGVGFLALAILLGFQVVKRLHRDRYGLQGFGMAGQVYQEMRDILSRAGLHGHPSQTPHEYLQGLKQELASEPAIVRLLQQVTESYTHVRFGGFHLSTGDSRELRLMWRQSKQAWRAFSLRRQALTLRDRLTDRIQGVKQENDHSR